MCKSSTLIGIATCVSLSSYCAALLPIQQGVIVADAADDMTPRKDILGNLCHVLCIGP
jgi:hypothetical protein